MPKCVCQICCCGQHRCPHIMPKPRKIINKDKDDCTISEYRGRYQTTETKRGPFRRPTDHIYQEGDMDFVTTTELHHKPQKLPSPVRREKNVYQKNDDPMELSTEYYDRYVHMNQKPASKMKYLREKTQPYDLDPNLGLENSVTAASFRGEQGLKTEKMFLPRDHYTPPKDPFNSSSVHRSDFIDFKKPRSSRTRRADNLKPGSGRFQADTTTSTNFVKHNQLPHIVKRSEVYAPNTEPFQGESVLKADFPAYDNARAADLAKWNNKIFDSSEGLSKETTTSIDYQKWDVKPEVVKIKQSYEKPEGTMQLKPVSCDFRHHGSDAARATSLRPKTSIRLGSATFHGKSAYQEVFREIPSERPRPIPQSKRNQRETFPLASKSEKMDYLTESMDTYRRLEPDRSKYSLKDSDLFPKDKLNDRSTYNSDYAPKELNCPSKELISTNFAGYEFVDDFESGHRFLKKINDKNTSKGSNPRDLVNKPTSTPPLPPLGEQGNLVAVA